MVTSKGIDWRAEQDRFMSLAYIRCERAARRAFKTWHSRKRDDAVQEALSKMWDQWKRLLDRGKDPEPMIGPLIHWAIMWVRYDRRIGGRGNPDLYDYRSGFKRQRLSGQGKASPTDRGDAANNWIDWHVKARTEDPAELAAALETAGMTPEQYFAA
jgi:hypothetical protein